MPRTLRNRRVAWLVLASLVLLLLFPLSFVAADDPPGSLLGVTPTATFTPTSQAPPPTPTLTPTPTPLPPPEKAGPSPVETVDPVVVKLGDPEEALPGEAVSFTIEVSNRGSIAAVGVVVSDEVSEYLEILEVETTQGTVSVDGQKVTVEVGVVGPEFVVRIVIHTRVRLDTPAPLVIENLVILRADNSSERTASTTVTIPDSVLPVTGLASDAPLTLGIAIGGLVAIVVLGFWEGRR